MRPLTFNPSQIARLFLLILGLLGGYTAWFGTHPEALVSIPCLFHLVTDIPCPGCGMTRACIALVQGDLPLAWHYHPLCFAFVALAFCAAFFPSALNRAWGQRRAASQNRIALCGVVLCVGVWGLRIF